VLVRWRRSHIEWATDQYVADRLSLLDLETEIEWALEHGEPLWRPRVRDYSLEAIVWRMHARRSPAAPW
jgi:hypothetical protein